MNLEEIEDLMRDRDHSHLVNEVQRVSNLRALADEVPGLVNEVRRLNLQVEAMRDVVETARRLVKGERWPYLLGGGHLAHAIDAYEKNLGCPKCGAVVPLQYNGTCGNCGNTAEKQISVVACPSCGMAFQPAEESKLCRECERA